MNETDLLFKARQLLLQALEVDGVDIAGSGFGMGQADIDVAVDGKNSSISMTLAELGCLDE